MMGAEGVFTLLGRCGWQRCRSDRDANNRIDVKAARASVPGAWLIVSHISGPNLVSPRLFDLVELELKDLRKLSGCDPPGLVGSFAGSSAKRGGGQGRFHRCSGCWDFHIQSSSKFFPQLAEIVPAESFATIMRHDHAVAVAAPQGPPALTQAWLMVVKMEKKRLGSKHVQVLRWTAGHWAGSMWPMLIEVFVVMWLIKVVMKLGVTGATRSSANITPAVFADQLSRRRFNETTARVEEIPEDEAKAKPKLPCRPQFRLLELNLPRVLPKAMGRLVVHKVDHKARWSD